MLQLAWGRGGGLAIALPTTVGIGVAAAILVLAVGLVLRVHRRWPRRRPPPQPDGNAVDLQTNHRTVRSRCGCQRGRRPRTRGGRRAGRHRLGRAGLRGRRGGALRHHPAGTSDAEITLTVPDSVAERGWGVQVFDERLEEAIAEPLAVPRARTEPLPDTNCPAATCSLFENKGGDCGLWSRAWPFGFIRAGDGPWRRPDVRGAARRADGAGQASRSRRRGGRADLARLGTVGCRPCRSPSPTSSSSLIRSSMIGISSSGFFRLLARPRAAGPGCAPAAPGHPACRRRCRPPPATGLSSSVPAGRASLCTKNVLTREEAETLLRVEPLHFPGGVSLSRWRDRSRRRRDAPAQASGGRRRISVAASPRLAVHLLLEDGRVDVGHGQDAGNCRRAGSAGGRPEPAPVARRGPDGPGGGGDGGRGRALRGRPQRDTGVVGPWRGREPDDPPGYGVALPSALPGGVVGRRPAPARPAGLPCPARRYRRPILVRINRGGPERGH